MKTRAFASILLALAAPASGCTVAGRADPIPASAAPSAIASSAPSAIASSAPSIVASSSSSAVPPIVTASASAPDAGARSPLDCPEGMAKIGRTCVDRWEAHLAVRGASGERVALPFFARPPEDGHYEAVSEEGAYPQGYISRVEAARACKNAGKRLCSMSEWQRACAGRRGAIYPYGPRREAGRCNTEKDHLLSIRYGTSPKKWTYEAFNDPTLDQEPGFLAQAGAYDRCTAGDGVMDMVGNLHEWVSDTVDEELVDRLAAEPVERKNQVWRPGNGVFMGGFFSTHDQLGPGCKYVTYAHEPTYHDYSTGFRCCADAPRPPRPKKTNKRR